MSTENPAAPGDVTPGTSQTPNADAGNPAPSQSAPSGEKPGDQKQSEQTASGEPTAENAGEGDAQQRPKPRSQRRIEALVQRVNQLTRERDYYQNLAQEGSRRTSLDPLDFPNDAAYQRALIEETARTSRTEFAKQQAEQVAREAAELELQVWNERAAEYQASVPDFEAVAYSTQVPYSPHMLQIVRNMERGPAIAYYLGKNIAEAQRISKLNPIETAIELGRLDQKLAGPARKTVTNVPEPPQTVRGGSVSTTPDLNAMSMEEYAAYRMSGRKTS